jgi:hypothetical protein
MSLNHVVNNGLAPALDLVCKDLYVEGNIIGTTGLEISPYNFRGTNFIPTGTNISNTPGGSGAGITGGSRLSLQKIGQSIQGTYKCDFETGTGGKGVVLTLIFPPGILVNPDELCVTATAFHQTGAGPWEQLYMSQANVISNVQFNMEFVRPDDTNFPANKQYKLNLTWSVKDDF